MAPTKTPRRLAGFLRYTLGPHVESDKWWAYLIVSVRLGLLAASLVLACYTRLTAMIGFALAAVIFAFPLATLVRIVFWDMATTGWRERSRPRFLLLVFANLVEFVFAIAAVLAAVESIERGATFAAPIDSPGAALVAALGPFGGSFPGTVTGWSQATVVFATVLLLFVTAVVIAAAVNGVASTDHRRADNAS